MIPVLTARFWLPRAGPPEKAVFGLGSRAHSLFECPRQTGNTRIVFTSIKITLFPRGEAEKKLSNITNIAVFSLATKGSWKNDAGT